VFQSLLITPQLKENIKLYYLINSQLIFTCPLGYSC